MSFRNYLMTFPLAILLSSCGGSLRVPGTATALDIAGSWHLVGQVPFPSTASSDPYIGLTIVKIGDMIYARGKAQAACSEGALSVIGSIQAKGQIAADGSFVLTDSSVPAFRLQYTIKGVIPQPGATGWHGSYEIGIASPVCNLKQSGSFLAIPYPIFKGTYSGTIYGKGIESGVSVTLRIAQGAPAVPTTGFLTSSTGVPDPYIPLTGLISMSGLNCMNGATLAGDFNTVFAVNSALEGDEFFVSAQASDGATMLFDGWFPDQTEKTIKPIGITISKGTCSGISGSGTLTLQP